MLTLLLFVWALAGQSKEELLAKTKYVEHPVSPTFAAVDGPVLRDGIKVVSGRSFAVFGFNNPAILVYLPPVDNSDYAVVEFTQPKVFDASNHEVKYELERGLFDRDRHDDQIRLTPGPDKKTVSFARAIGTIKIRYPSKVKTLTIRGKGTSDVTIDGPFVTYPSTLPVPETSPIAALRPLRAFDASGRQLESASSSGTTHGFWGKVASAQIDVVESWQQVDISYELPSVPLHPALAQGLEPPVSKMVAPTPGGKVTITLAPPAGGPPPTAGDEGGAPIGRDAALAELRRAGYPDAAAANFVASTVKHDWAVVRLFLAAGVPIDALYERDHVTALHRAADSGNVDVALHLLRAGANPNVQDDIGASVLLSAASHCDAAPLVKALIAAGAQPNAKSRGGATPLAVARSHNCADNASLIAKAGGR